MGPVADPASPLAPASEANEIRRELLALPSRDDFGADAFLSLDLSAPRLTLSFELSRRPMKTTPGQAAPSSAMRTELIFGLVGTVGTDLDWLSRTLSDCLRAAQYKNVSQIRLSNYLARFRLSDAAGKPIRLRLTPEDLRIRTHMNAGSALRRRLEGDALALLAIEEIYSARKAKVCATCNHLDFPAPRPGTAFILRSLKHPDEVLRLRRTYGSGFFLIGAFQDRISRKASLAKRFAKTSGSADATKFLSKAEALIEKDYHDSESSGQHVRDSFHLSDFFVSLGAGDEASQKAAKGQLDRFVRLIMGDVLATPASDEVAMFHAQAAALRSADLSRQVGAVLATQTGEIVATGCNDVPRAGGGSYWAGDPGDGRDLTLDQNPSVRLRDDLVEDIIQRFRQEKWVGSKPRSTQEALRVLGGSKVGSLIEFYRAVHAEMDVLLSAARLGVPTKNLDLFCTTFPCHDCAKHIVASGVRRVTYIEPYPKSRATDLYPDSISLSEDDSKVWFRPFEGVGPRRFGDLFSTTTSTGRRLRRQDNDGKPMRWSPASAEPRIPLLLTSYVEREGMAIGDLAERMGKKMVGGV